MTELKISLSLSCLKQEKIDQISALFQDFKMDCLFDGRKLSSQPVSIEATPSYSFYEEEILNSINALLEKYPNSSYLTLPKMLIESRWKNNPRYQVSVNLTYSLPLYVSADTKKCIITEDPLASSINFDSVNLAETSFEFFETIYDEEIKRICYTFVIVIILSHPEIYIGNAYLNVYLNSRLYIQEFYLDQNQQEYASEEHPQIFTEKFSLNKTFSWLKQNTELYDPSQPSNIAFSALTQALCRSGYESLIYAIIGLENLFIPKEHSKSEKLQKRIRSVFPNVTAADIRKMYSLRSNFVHGELKMDTCCVTLPSADEESVNAHKTSTLATALLLESIRKLIAQNATCFHFEENIQYSIQ